MRITPEILMKITRDTVSRRAREDRSILAAYLCGSLLEQEYLMGGAADVDMVFVHTYDEGAEREIVRLTDDVHLDIAHHLQKDYLQTRHLRLHPWLGPTLTVCMVLYDPQHFMDFTQASVRGQFDRPDRVVKRSRAMIERARQAWLDFQVEMPDSGPDAIYKYLGAVGNAGNAIAGLTGLPLTERRYILLFPRRAEAVGRPGLHAGLLGLLGAPNLNARSLDDWLPAWDAAYQYIPAENAPARLLPARHQYYRKAFDALIQTEQPQAILWPLLRTWTLAAGLLPPQSSEREAWRVALEQLGLMGDLFADRIDALDSYLDLVEETVETWARLHGEAPI